MNFFESPPVLGRYTQSPVSESKVSKHEPSSAATALKKVPPRPWASAVGVEASASVDGRSRQNTCTCSFLGMVVTPRLAGAGGREGEDV